MGSSGSGLRCCHHWRGIANLRYRGGGEKGGKEGGKEGREKGGEEGREKGGEEGAEKGGGEEGAEKGGGKGTEDRNKDTKGRDAGLLEGCREGSKARFSEG